MSQQERKPRHRPMLIALAVLGAAICLLMAYWQFSRWDSASGSSLNFGYALQWPFFGLFLFFLYQRFISLEADRDLQKSREAKEAAGETLPAQSKPQEKPVTEIPPDLLPTRRPTVDEVEAPDDTIAAYNDYLAELDRRADDTARTPGDGTPGDRTTGEG